jgi:hypothetical protein
MWTHQQSAQQVVFEMFRANGWAKVQDSGQWVSRKGGEKCWLPGPSEGGSYRMLKSETTAVVEIRKSSIVVWDFLHSTPGRPRATLTTEVLGEAILRVQREQSDVAKAALQKLLSNL